MDDPPPKRAKLVENSDNNDDEEHAAVKVDIGKMSKRYLYLALVELFIRCNRLQLPKSYLIEVGQFCKRLLNLGRQRKLEELGFTTEAVVRIDWSSVLVSCKQQYVDEQASRENIMIIAYKA